MVIITSLLYNDIYINFTNSNFTIDIFALKLCSSLSYYFFLLLISFSIVKNK